MPWLTLGEPGRMMCWHQAHIRVGRRRAAVIAVVMIGELDNEGAGIFKNRDVAR